MMRHSATRLAPVVSFGAAFAGREANNARAVVILRKSKRVSFWRDTTVNLTVDDYYAYNFNRQFGGINMLRLRRAERQLRLESGCGHL